MTVTVASVVVCVVYVVLNSRTVYMDVEKETTVTTTVGFVDVFVTVAVPAKIVFLVVVVIVAVA